MQILEERLAILEGSESSTNGCYEDGLKLVSIRAKAMHGYALIVSAFAFVILSFITPLLS
jgi:hypothetical protein